MSGISRRGPSGARVEWNTKRRVWKLVTFAHSGVETRRSEGLHRKPWRPPGAASRRLGREFRIHAQPLAADARPRIGSPHYLMCCGGELAREQRVIEQTQHMSGE